MKSNNKIEAIIYLILVLVLCASLVGVITNITKKGEEFFGAGGDKPSSTTTTEKATTTKPTKTTKPVEATQKPAETTQKPAETTAPHEHNDYKSVVVKEPTCFEIGKKEFYCTVCDVKQREEDIPKLTHSFINCVCVNCGLVEHSNVSNEAFYYSYGDGTHVMAYDCLSCDYNVFLYETLEQCSYDENHVCVKCSYTCLHDKGVANVEISYIPNGDGTHSFYGTCNACGLRIPSSEPLSCTYESGECTFCGGSCPHEHTSLYESKLIPYENIYSGYHIREVKCFDCGEYVPFFQATQCTYEDGICECGGRLLET